MPIKLLPLARILESKRAAGRTKDAAALHALEVAVRVIGASKGTR